MHFNRFSNLNGIVFLPTRCTTSGITGSLLSVWRELGAGGRGTSHNNQGADPISHVLLGKKVSYDPSEACGWAGKAKPAELCARSVALRALLQDLCCVCMDKRKARELAEEPSSVDPFTTRPLFEGSTFLLVGGGFLSGATP